MEWLLLIGLAFVAYWWFSKRSSGGNDDPPTSRRSTLGSANRFHMDGDGSFEFDIVGESHYQDALDAICGGKCEEGHELECVALLRREPHNKHDPNAIAVMINGRKVGHLSRTDARAISQLLDRRGLKEFTADAMIVGGWTRRSGDGHYGVKLDLPV